MPEGHTVSLQVERQREKERERKRENGPGALPLLRSKGGVSNVFQVCSLLANIK